jgi:predicted GNAT family N-acyltransferase
MNNLNIRYNTLSDTQQIIDLITLCFGKVSDAFFCYDKRYLLLIKNDKIIALTGIYKNNDKVLEIDWTCTHPAYRNQGYMYKLFEKLLENIQDPVVCNCWRIKYQDINLKKLMIKFGFKLIKKECKYSNNSICNRNCPYDYKDRLCECYEDLYQR